MGAGLSRLAKVDDHAFAGGGNTFSIVDLSESTLVSVVDEYAFYNFKGTIVATGLSVLAKVGTYAFRGAGNSKSIVDLSGSLLVVEMGKNAFLNFKGTKVLPATIVSTATPTIKLIPSATPATTSTTATSTTPTASTATITTSTATTATSTTPTTTTTTTTIATTATTTAITAPTTSIPKQNVGTFTTATTATISTAVTEGPVLTTLTTTIQLNVNASSQVAIKLAVVMAILLFLVAMFAVWTFMQTRKTAEPTYSNAEVESATALPNLRVISDGTPPRHAVHRFPNPMYNNTAPNAGTGGVRGMVGNTVQTEWQTTDGALRITPQPQQGSNNNTYDAGGGVQGESPQADSESTSRRNRLYSGPEVAPTNLPPPSASAGGIYIMGSSSVPTVVHGDNGNASGDPVQPASSGTGSHSAHHWAFRTSTAEDRIAAGPPSEDAVDPYEETSVTSFVGSGIVEGLPTEVAADNNEEAYMPMVLRTHAGELMCIDTHA